MSDQGDPAELEQARHLFRRFQDRDPESGELILVGGLKKPATALLVGSAVSLAYNALGDGKNYYHEFEAALPQVFVNAAGDQVYFIGGSYRFTERGFLK
jgi:hypothetical protein